MTAICSGISLLMLALKLFDKKTELNRDKGARYDVWLYPWNTTQQY